MKFLIVPLMVFALQAQAEPQVRGEVDSNLSQERGWVRVDGLPIEMVRDSNILPPAQLLHPNTWNPDISLSKLKTLVLQQIHLKTDGVKKEAIDSVLVPYVSEVYFQQRHDSVNVLGANVGEGVQGTIRFSGHLRTRVLAGSISAVEISVELYQNSNRTESALANLSEHINRYDQRFMNDIAHSIITNLFQRPEYRAQLERVINARK